MFYHMEDGLHAQNIKLSVENHLHQLGYVYHIDIWVPHKQKNLLDSISTCNFYLNIVKCSIFKTNCEGNEKVDTTHYMIMWNGRDGGISEMNHHQPHILENQAIDSNKYCFN